MPLRKVLLIRPPRYVWPFFNDSDNFLLPLGLASIASSIRRGMPHLEVKVVDCPVLKIGWKSLRRILEEEKPDVVSAGEGLVYYHEAVRLFRVAKEADPGVITIAGGHFFSWMPDPLLGRFPIDHIVRFEGEETIVDLLRVLEKGQDPVSVRGIAYRKDGVFVKTPLRPLLSDLDRLPVPAFDLMPMQKYAPRGYIWRGSATLEHSRGCIDQCDFCSLWTYWGRQENVDVGTGGLSVSPCYRTKSVERTLEEIDIVYGKYGRRYIAWADPTFNADPSWNDEFCEKLIKRNYKDLRWWAYIRADHALRDEHLGILEKMVRAGLNHAFIGVERSSTEDLRRIHKSGCTREMTEEVFHVFRQKYPGVFTQASFVTCFPFDTKESMRTLGKYARKIDADLLLFQTVAPSLGTFLYEEAKRNDLLEKDDIMSCDWMKPAMRSYSGLSVDDFALLNDGLNRRFFVARPAWIWRGFFSPYRFKRRFYRGWFLSAARMMLQDILDLVLGRAKKGATAFRRMRKPAWYER